MRDPQTTSRDDTGSTAVADRTQQNATRNESTNPRLELFRLPFLGRGVIFNQTAAHGSKPATALIIGVHENTGIERRCDLYVTGQNGQPYAVMNVPYGDQQGCWDWNERLDLAIFGPDYLAATGSGVQNTGG